jgi:hypothetical protein
MSGGDTPFENTERTIWLSGAIVTFMSKLVMPAAWLAGLIAVPVWVYMKMGRISIRPDFQFIVWFALIATALLAWLTVHLQLVGYRGSELVIANYWREARVPFTQVEAVEAVWWYKGRLVRIRFATPTPFGSTVYYLPKWGSLRALFSSPERELRNIIGIGG